MGIVWFTDRGTQVDIHVRPKWIAEVISQFRSIPEEGCISYEKEEHKPDKKGGWYILRNVTGKPWAVAELFAALCRTGESIGGDTIYIMTHRRKAKANVQKLGKEAGAGRKGGNHGETGADIRLGGDRGSSGDADRNRNPGHWNRVAVPEELFADDGK